MSYCARITTEPVAAKEIRLFGLGAFFLERFHERLGAALAEMTLTRLHELRLFVLFGGLHGLVLGGSFWYVAAQARAGQLTLGDVALYLAAVAQAESHLLSFSGSFGLVHDNVVHLRALFAFLDGARPAIALATAGAGVQAAAALRSGIEFRQVRFGYPQSDGEVLAEVSARLPAGQVTALVGANGAGKSTLVKLLTRMYDPSDGEILLDGLPLASYDLASLRRRIAVVYQDFACFSLTLRENIVVASIEPGHDDSRFDQAAQWAGADAVAARPPRGYDTPLTRRFDGGVDLSGGEWQKVALARGFLRDAALVILDEPTAALDAEAEAQLFARFREIVVGKTALVISHRLSTVRMADQIVVLQGGCIVEAGSHADLAASGGLYAMLYELQARRNREDS
jgi:ATP-binding cassette subfamily B protein